MNATHFSIRRTATEIRNARVITKIVWSVISLVAILMTIVYVTSVLYSRTGSFTVTVAKLDQIQYSISLSETPDFAEPSTRLSCAGTQEVFCMSGNTLPADIDQINGQHNGEDYVAYTFYCKNTGTEPIDLRYETFIVSATKGIDAAAYVRLYVSRMDENGNFPDRSFVTYARTRNDGTGQEEGTTPFLSNNTITRKNIENLTPQDMVKFTVVIWLEGDDEECTDSILGGSFKVDMTLNVLNAGAE